MKYPSFCFIFLIFASCSAGGKDNEIPDDVESVGGVKKYKLYIQSTHGGSMWVTSQEGTIHEADVEEATSLSFTNPAGDVLVGKYVGMYPRDTALHFGISLEEGYRFTGWTGYKCNKCYWAATPFSSQQSSLTLSINSDVLINATFAENGAAVIAR